MSTNIYFYAVLVVLFAIAFIIKFIDYKYAKKLENEYKKLGKERYEFAKKLGMFRWI